MNNENKIDEPTVESLFVQNTELKSYIRDRDMRDAMTNALQLAGARSPTLMYEAVKERVSLDDEGKPQNVELLIKGLRHTNPEQFARDVSAADAAAGVIQKNEPLTREMLAKMSPAEIRDLDWQTVRQLLRG